MPESRKVHWSQLKVGVVAFVAMVIVLVLGHDHELEKTPGALK